MIDLYYVDTFPEERFRAWSLEGAEADEVRALTFIGFEFRRGSSTIALGGFMLRNLVSGVPYAWIKLLETPTHGELLRAMKMAPHILAVPKMPLAAEVDPADPVASRFVRACGFTFNSSLGDRDLYTRGC